jgi:hypothetical protein
MLDVQRELPQNMVFEASYIGSVSRHLESLRAVNEAIPACPSRNARPGCENDSLAGLTVPNRSPFPNFGRIQLVDNGNNGSYNGVTAKVTKRYSNGLMYIVSHTWAKSIDTSTAIRTLGGDTLFPQDSYCRSCEKGRSSHDVRHRFAASSFWDLPIGKGRKADLRNPVANAIVGGWQTGLILGLQTGFPITVTNGLDTSNTGAFFDRPDWNGQDPSLPRGQQDPQRFFDTRVYSFAPAGTHGNAGRNTLTSPGIIQLDFSMHKDFMFTERHKLQFRFEAFNFPNHPNWNSPNANIASGSSFGVITGTRNSMRQLQFALKYNF